MEVKKILAIRNDRFGEFLLNIPAFRALKETYKSAALSVVVDPYVCELAKAVDSVDDVITWENRRHTLGEIFRLSQEIKKQKFNICVVLNPSKDAHLVAFLAGIPVRAGYKRKWPFLLTHTIEDKKYLGLKHEVEYNLDLVNLVKATIDDKQLYLRVDSDINSKFLRDFNIDGDGLIAVHPWTSDAVKQWPIENFSRLIERISTEVKAKVIIVGGQLEASRQREFLSLNQGKIINMVGKTTLMQLAALLKRCQLLISGDSGPVHLACSVNTAVVAIFRNDLPGKTPVRWGPWGQNNSVIARSSLSEIGVEEVLNKIKLGMEIS